MKGYVLYKTKKLKMKIVDKRLRETADVINKKFAKVNEENRSEVSGEILSHLRNFCETFMYKVYDEENDADIYIRLKTI